METELNAESVAKKCKKCILKSNLPRSPRQIQMLNQALVLSMAYFRTASLSSSCTLFQRAMRPATQQPVILSLQIFPGQWPMPQSVQRSLHNLLATTFVGDTYSRNFAIMSPTQNEKYSLGFGCIKNCHRLQVLLCLRRLPVLGPNRFVRPKTTINLTLGGLLRQKTYLLQ